MRDMKLSSRPSVPTGHGLSHGELLLWPTLLYLYLFIVLRLGDLDRAVAGLFAAARPQGFPLRHAFVTEFVLHDAAQTVMKAVVLVLLLAWLASWSDRRLARWRRVLGYLVLTAVVSVGLVNLGKRLTNVDCPWDLQEFGGNRVHSGLLHAKPAAAPLGHCFPGGHSSSGFALFGLFFLVRRQRPSRAALGALPAVLLGVIFAVDQWARGAHFPSHDLTTAYLCWLVALAGDWLILGRGGPPARSAD